jgi:PAS domain-containing protein
MARHVLVLSTEQIRSLKASLLYTSDVVALNVHHVPLGNEADKARLKRVVEMRHIVDLAEEAPHAEDYLPDIPGTVVIDPTGNILVWGDLATRLFGVSREDAMGRRPKDVGIVADEDDAQAIQTGFALHGQWEGEVHITNAANKRLMVWARFWPEELFGQPVVICSYQAIFPDSIR